MAQSKKCEPRLRPHLLILQTLANTSYSSKLKTEALKHCSNDCILKICKIVYNILKGVVPLTSSQKRQIHSRKHILRRIVQSQTIKERRALLVSQKGGFATCICGHIAKKS
jgi:hypothetical protein